jgi:hypothetical protein
MTGRDSLPDEHAVAPGRRRAVVPTSVPPHGWLDSKEIRFSQSSIKSEFRNPAHGTIDDLAEGLRNGIVDGARLDPIRIVEVDGKLYALDNRRLCAFRRAAVAVRYRHATQAEIDDELRRKFNPVDDGQRIRIRGGGWCE